MGREEPIDFRHGQRVRVGGFNGPRGVMMRCKRRAPATGTYWKVKLSSGEWVWPNDVVADTDGPHQYRCQECGITFRSKTVGDPHCPGCDTREAVEQSYRDSRNIRNSSAYFAGSRMASPTDRQVEPTPETDRKAAIRKVADEYDDWTPFG